MSLVMQTPLLFSGSIADNIRYGRLDATHGPDRRGREGGELPRLHLLLPRTATTRRSGRAARSCSGGERQRIAVARAFIRAAPILILDEPTSAIDSKTESVILDALENLMEGRTSFMIAHRLSTIRDANLILVLNHGMLVEQGTHEQLLARRASTTSSTRRRPAAPPRSRPQYAQDALAAATPRWRLGHPRRGRDRGGAGPLRGNRRERRAGRRSMRPTAPARTRTVPAPTANGGPRGPSRLAAPRVRSRRACRCGSTPTGAAAATTAISCTSFRAHSCRCVRRANAGRRGRRSPTR